MAPARHKTSRIDTRGVFLLPQPGPRPTSAWPPPNKTTLAATELREGLQRSLNHPHLVQIVVAPVSCPNASSAWDSCR